MPLGRSRKISGTEIEWDISAACDLNLLRDDIDTIKKHGSLTLVRRFGLEVNTEETKYMLLSRPQNSGHNHDIKES
jgi:hypothetical protein